MRENNFHEYGMGSNTKSVSERIDEGATVDNRSTVESNVQNDNRSMTNSEQESVTHRMVEQSVKSIKTAEMMNRLKNVRTNPRPIAINGMPAGVGTPAAAVIGSIGSNRRPTKIASIDTNVDAHTLPNTNGRDAIVKQVQEQFQEQEATTGMSDTSISDVIGSGTAGSGVKSKSAKSIASSKDDIILDEIPTPDTDVIINEQKQEFEGGDHVVYESTIEEPSLREAVESIKESSEHADERMQEHAQAIDAERAEFEAVIGRREVADRTSFNQHFGLDEHDTETYAQVEAYGHELAVLDKKYGGRDVTPQINSSGDAAKWAHDKAARDAAYAAFDEKYAGSNIVDMYNENKKYKDYVKERNDLAIAAHREFGIDNLGKDSAPGFGAINSADEAARWSQIQNKFNGLDEKYGDWSARYDSHQEMTKNQLQKVGEDVKCYEANGHLPVYDTMSAAIKDRGASVENDLAGAGVDVKSMLRAASMSAQASNQMSTV